MLDGAMLAGATLEEAFAIYRIAEAIGQAPTIDMVLADLIHRGHLPHGTYRIEVAW